MSSSSLVPEASPSHCRVCWRYIQSQRVTRFASLCIPCWRRLGRSLSLASVPKPLSSVGSPLASGPEGGDCFGNCASSVRVPPPRGLETNASLPLSPPVEFVGPEPSFTPGSSVLSSRGRDVSGHLLWSQDWSDFNAWLDPGQCNTDRLRMDNLGEQESDSHHSDDYASDLHCADLGEEEASASGSSSDDLVAPSESSDLSVGEQAQTPGLASEDPIRVDERGCVGTLDSACRNCRRERSVVLGIDAAPELEVVLVLVDLTELCFRHQWKSFTRRNLSRATRQVTLCVQCKHVLVKPAREGPPSPRFHWRNVWPVYMWRLLTNPLCLDRYGSDTLHFVPRQWWPFWKAGLVSALPGVYSLLAFAEYEASVAVIVDRTMQKRRFRDILKQNRLGQLQEGCNRYLEATILCPWGCSGFLHNAGWLSYDAVVSSFFPYLDFVGRMSSSSQQDSVASARRDYFSFYVGCQLFNPDWCVQASVYFDPQEGPVFLSCDDHHGGTKERYFHAPKSRNCLPPLQGDQLSFVVLRARTLHRAKAKRYSNTYQMNMFLGNYSGLDSTWVSDVIRRFDFHSHLSDLSEARSFRAREDIRGLARRLDGAGAMGQGFLESLEQRSGELFPSLPYLEQCCQGATMMTLLDVMRLQKAVAAPSSMDVLVERKGREHILSVQRLWPLHLIRVHPYDSLGCRMLKLSPMRSRGAGDYRLLWFTFQALLNVDVLWTHASASVRDEWQWQGHLLSYLGHTVLKQTRRSRDKSHPFYVPAKSIMRKPAGLSAKLYSATGSASSGYNLRDYSLLFRSEVDQGLVAFLKFRFMDLLIVEDECDVLWFVNPDRRTDIRPISPTISAGGSIFELRFMAWSVEGTSSKPGSWDGGVWARHGSRLFPHWWRHNRKGTVVSAPDTTDMNWADIDMALYIRLRPVELEGYRREYLRYIGGQVRVGCKVHDVPLVTAPKKVSEGQSCSVGASQEAPWCGNPASYECPVVGCPSCICTSCFAGLDSATMTMVGTPTGVRSGASGSVSEESSCLVDTSEDESDDEAGCIVRFPSGPGVNLDDFGSEASFSSSSSGSSQGDVPETVNLGDDLSLPPAVDTSCLNTGFGCIGEGTGDGAPDCSSDEEADQFLPTTHAGGCGLDATGRIRGMGTSVLLNKCGSMLVRRQTRLEASRRERNLLERVASQEAAGTIPLVYLEGLLFPSIFWALPSCGDGGILGSIPTALFCQHDTRKLYNVASMADHAKMRLKSVDSSASTDPRYLSFLFDTLANGAIEGHDTRLVLNRGFESCMGPAGMRLRDKDDDLYTDGIDNRQNVHNLCAAERIRPSTLFVTLTCNQSHHFGVKKIKQYVDSGAAISNYVDYLKKDFPGVGELSAVAMREVQLAMNEAARCLIVRHWLEVKRFLLNYILHSPELPMGLAVDGLFSRDEYQGTEGNLPHMHMLVTLAEGYETEEGRRAVQGAVRGFVDDIVTGEEVDQLIAEGVLQDRDDYFVMKDQARRFLVHRHTARCMRRTGPGPGDLVCRVPDTRYISRDVCGFYESVLQVRHCKEALDILERLELVHIDSLGNVIPRRDFLSARRIYAPARFGEGSITPVLGRLFASTRSTMNVQICTSHGTSRYVVKYVIKVDETNYVAFVSKQGEPGLRAEQVFLHNTKITSSAINEKKRLDAGRDKARPRGRAVAVTEMMQIILGKPQVYCNIEFVRVPTLPLGERAGIERRPPEEVFEELEASGKIKSNKDSFDFMVPIVQYRLDNLSCSRGWRCCTNSQVLMLKDQMVCRLSLDRVFVFGVRPPELLPFDKMEWYFRYFERSSRCVLTKASPLEDFLTCDLRKSAWIDGLGRRLRLRPTAIPLVAKLLLLDVFRDQFINRGALPMLLILDQICSFYAAVGITLDSEGNRKPELSLVANDDESKDWDSLQRTFLAYYTPSKLLPVVVFSNVRPRNACKFAIHLVLSMGHFETERDVWAHPSIRGALTRCRLIPPGPCNSVTVDGLLTKWIDDQLKTYPVNTSTLDQYIICAHDIIESLLIHDALPINEIPPVMYTSLVQYTDQKIQRFLREAKESCIDATLKALNEVYGSHLPSVLPSRVSLLDATKDPLTQPSWRVVLPETSAQSRGSYLEQKRLNAELVGIVDQYRVPGPVLPKNMLIAGPPGVGKTHCMGHSVCYSLSKGLYVMTTAVLAERAFLLGGRHLHLLFKLRVRDKGTPHRLAELAVIALSKHPELFVLLKTIDVLYVDECGQISAELLSVLDIILRKVRGSSLFMGGMLVIGTIDQVQLRPIKGLPFLLSPYVFTTFRMRVLKHYVRCADCPVLQEMNQLARSLNCSQRARASRLSKLRRLVQANCTFVESWQDPVITDDVLRVFPRKEETAAAVRSFLVHKRAAMVAARKPYRRVIATDSMVGMESHADWKPASPPVVNLLSKECKEPPSLEFYEGAIYQFTCNCPGRFKSTQLGVLLSVPSVEQLERFADLDIYVAPAGVKTLPSSSMNPVRLLALGFRLSKVGPAPDRSKNFWRQGVKAKRKQYAIRHHVAATIHSAIGHTVSALATELSASNSMWERAMVVVLISRVKKASQLVFVGDQEANVDALIGGLSVRNQYDEYMDHVVSVLSGRIPSHSPLLMGLHPFRYKDIPLPQDTSGVVYLLVSQRDACAMYIGMTRNMLRRLGQHNSGFGSLETAPREKRPWGLYAYVTGFAGSKDLMRRLEGHWQRAVQNVGPPTPREAVSILQRILARDYIDSSLLVAVAQEEY